MNSIPVTDHNSFENLRQLWYNATVVDRKMVHNDLMILRVRPDEGMPNFVAGQYTALGLGDWEPRVSGASDEDTSSPPSGRLIRRAYSVSASLLNDYGQLVRVSDCDYLEFYVALVRHSGRVSPSLTPRLFHLQTGDRLSCAIRFHGSYTLAGVESNKNIIFAATGTGEAPHNGMLAELLSSGHQGQIASIVCARFNHDFGYLAAHRELEHRFTNYRYLTLTTREKVNLDPDTIGYVGKRYLQDFFQSGDFEQTLGWRPSPENTEVFLCGSPDMIGFPEHCSDGTLQYPQPKGMIELLASQGFRLSQPGIAGNIHVEKYW